MGLFDTCKQRQEVSFFETAVHVVGWDCDSLELLLLFVAITIGLKLWQNKVWADMAQAQRTALQLSVGERGEKICNLVKLEAISTTLGLVSIILVLGSNAWIMLAIIVGNLWGVYTTYSHKTKDSHSTAHDLVEMLQKYDKDDNPTTAEFVALMRELLNNPDVKPNTPKYQRYTDREIKF